MFSVSRTIVLPLVLALGLALSLTACSTQETKSEGFEWLPLFGNGLHDTSPVLATVGDIKITQRDLDLRFDELPKQMKSRFEGEEGQRLLLKDMVDQALMVMGAVEGGLYNDTDVARTLISQRRSALDSAMRNYGLLRDNEPTEEEIRAYFDQNRDDFRQEPLARARHVECLSKAEANKAYERLERGGAGNSFAEVVRDFSKNIESGKNSGDLGWFNGGGYLPTILGGKEFTERVIRLDKGLHPPFLLQGRWHVVEVQDKEYGRPMTFKEARDLVLQTMLPSHQMEIIRKYLREARQKHPVTFEGKYAPGKGLTAEQIFQRGMGLADPQKKIDMFNLIISDFPDSDRADDALFMSGMVVLERWGDRREASLLFQRILDDYPESEYVENVKFLAEHRFNPTALNPSSIEELRKK